MLENQGTRPPEWAEIGAGVFRLDMPRYLFRIYCTYCRVLCRHIYLSAMEDSATPEDWHSGGAIISMIFPDNQYPAVGRAAGSPTKPNCVECVRTHVIHTVR